MKYQIGDKVRIKSLDWYNKNKDEFGVISCGIQRFTPNMSWYCGKILIISCIIESEGCYGMLDAYYYWTDEMIEGLVEEENNDCEKCSLTRNSTRCLFMDNCPHNKQKNIIEIPEDCVLKDENGNIINTTKIILEKKKKEYPKTCEECYQVTGLSKTSDIYGYKNGLLFEFQKLLIARDAYWKIAGEEMGLGKPWKARWSDNYQKKWIINFYQDEINLTNGPNVHFVLAFPTEEMRDAFYENFKELIEQCKELL